ncbi:MAG TPA: PilZ domain-containing protein [Devosia sp.]|nr:PilZ domain-containing protein [Devosia sp.]
MQKLSLPLSQPASSLNDVRFIGAIAGRYALSDRRAHGGRHPVPIYACRLCSISTTMAVVVAPVVGEEGEAVTAHFDELGIIRARVSRRLQSGFAMDLAMSAGERDKLGAKIAWQKKRVHGQVPDRREFRRVAPRDPTTILTLHDGTQVPCFVIDMSRSGVAVSAQYCPEPGTALAVGRLVGRVVRYLDVGFAIQFVQLQALDGLDALLMPPQRASAGASSIGNGSHY